MTTATAITAPFNFRFPTQINFMIPKTRLTKAISVGIGRWKTVEDQTLTGTHLGTIGNIDGEVEFSALNLTFEEWFQGVDIRGGDI